ncbi:MAG: hypothetical protein V8T00_09750 [Oscillospiraceae bacterium]
MSLADIERRLKQLDEQFQRLLAEAINAEDKEACNAQFAGNPGRADSAQKAEGNDPAKQRRHETASAPA